MGLGARWAWCLAGLIVLAWPSAAAAQDDPYRAADVTAKIAYDRGLGAGQAGDYARAARWFARADELSPNDTALGSALRAADKVGDAALVRELTGRAERRGGDELTTLAAELRQRYGPEPPPAPVVEPPAPVVEAPPPVVELPPPVLVAPPPPPPAPLPSQPDPRLSPAWFWTSLGVTALLGAGAIASAVDTQSRHDDYEATGLGAAAGEEAQLRTNVFFFSAVGLSAVTVTLGVITFAGDGS